MNSQDKILEIMKHVKCSFELEINRHRDFYETAEEYIKDQEEKLQIDIDSKEIRQKMIETNTIVSVIFYPDTPIGNYSFYHYDVNLALDMALNILKEESK